MYADAHVQVPVVTMPLICFPFFFFSVCFFDFYCHGRGSWKEGWELGPCSDWQLSGPKAGTEFMRWREALTEGFEATCVSRYKYILCLRRFSRL